MAAEAMTVIPMTFESLSARLGRRVRARGRCRGRWTDDRRAIESIVTVDALRYLKGDLGEQVAVRVPGGRAGGFVNVLPGVPVLREGDLVVLFLAANGPAIPSPLGLHQGVFRVTSDASGVTRVTAPMLKASAAGRAIRGASDRRALTLEVFAAEVRVGRRTMKRALVAVLVFVIAGFPRPAFAYLEIRHSHRHPHFRCEMDAVSGQLLCN